MAANNKRCTALMPTFLGVAIFELILVLTYLVLQLYFSALWICFVSCPLLLITPVQVFAPLQGNAFIAVHPPKVFLLHS